MQWFNLSDAAGTCAAELCLVLRYASGARTSKLRPPCGIKDSLCPPLFPLGPLPSSPSLPLGIPTGEKTPKKGARSRSPIQAGSRSASKEPEPRAPSPLSVSDRPTLLRSLSFPPSTPRTSKLVVATIVAMLP